MISGNGQVMPWQLDTFGRQSVAATNTTSAVLLALGVNAALAAASCAAYVATGSSALLSFAAHTLIVASSHALLMFGIRRARRTSHTASDLHFWSYVAPLLLLSMGAGLALFAGVDRLHDPHPIVEPDTAYAVLGVSAIVAALSIWSAVAAYNARGLQLRSFAALRNANEPALFSALVQDFSVLTSTALAFAGVFFSHRFTIAEADGLAA
ncbi:MAG: cation transporter, partial [Hyphomicrobium sp.]